MKTLFLLLLQGTMIAVVAQQDAASTAGKVPGPASHEAAVPLFGLVESDKALMRLEFRLPPSQVDGSLGSPLALSGPIGKDGKFTIDKELPPRFVVGTVPPCVPLKTLIIGDRIAVSEALKIASAGTRLSQSNFDFSLGKLFTWRSSSTEVFNGRERSGGINTDLLGRSIGLSASERLGGINLGCPENDPKPDRREVAK